MRTWIWPFNWYQRIQELKAENAALKLAYKDLENKFRAEAITHSAALTAMLSSMNEVMAESQRRYREYTEWRCANTKFKSSTSISNLLSGS